MAELTVTTFISLDGVMQAPGGPDEDTSGNFPYGGWVFPLIDDDFGKVIVDIFAGADAFLLGRTTYDIFAAYWPKVIDPADPVATKLNSLPKYVASRTRTDFPWHDSHHLPEVVTGVAELKKRYAREVQVHGSAGLLQTLIERDLVDEFRLLTFPVTLGTGKRLFGSGTMPRTMKLIRSQTTGNGAVFSVYRPVGKLITGTFALE
jgi:dihydrofolate reductase